MITAYDPADIALTIYFAQNPPSAIYFAKGGFSFAI